MPLYELNTFYNIKFQDKTSAIKKQLVAYKGNFRRPNKPQVNISQKLIIWLVYKPDYILTAQINAGIPFVILQKVAVDVPAVYYNTIIAIIKIIKENLELVDSNYIYCTLADCYLGGQLPYSWFNMFQLLKIFYVRFIYVYGN